MVVILTNRAGRLTSMGSGDQQCRLYGFGQWERMFSYVIVKSRKFESSYRNNVTETSVWVYYIPTVHHLQTILWIMDVLKNIISLGVGRLALLIFTMGQCESQTIEIGTEDLTPTSESFINLQLFDFQYILIDFVVL